MANINITWTALAGTVTDVTSVEVWRCDDLSKTTEQDFQDELDGTPSAITLVENGLDFDSSSVTSPDVQNAGTYYYCVAAKNSGGYKVGNGDGTAVAFVTVS
tara:strand:- start:505 stop:810 length:306 start_codon:yes stop_codon:yes gene_type:complete